MLRTGTLVACLICIDTCNGTEPGLKPWENNQWYWSYHGKPILLLGGSNDDNLFQWPKEMLIAHLDRLAAAGGNVIRNTMSDRRDKGFELYPYAQRADGKYDLEAWNPAYWARFERMLRETHKRSIVVQIELWDRFDYTDKGGENHWQRHPYNPKNNINYTYEESGFAKRYPKHPSQNEQPFFFTTTRQQNNLVVLPYQQRFVDKLLENTLRYDHVLYCIDNETKAEEEWGRYWAAYLKRQANSVGKSIQVTEMWDDWDLTAKRHKRTFDHPELYDFVDVSQNNHKRGQEHWDNFFYVRRYLAKQPRPINTTKTYGADGNKFGHSDQDAIERFWRHLLAGAASIRFHRPPSGLGLNHKAVACIQAARKLEAKIPLWTVKPANRLVAERLPNQAYLAARPGHSYVLYLPKGGTVRVDLSDVAGELQIYWIEIATGNWGPQQSIDGAGKRPLTAPEGGNWVAAIVKAR